MAINTQSILSTLETKIASMDSNTPLDDMIVNIKSYQEAGGVVSIQYDSSGAMPILDSAQAGLVLYSASDTALYGFNGNNWQLWVMLLLVMLAMAAGYSREP